MPTGNDVVAALRSVAGAWYYTNDEPERSNPETSHGTDCSGAVRWAYRKVTGIDIGTYTGTQSSAGWEIARGHHPSEIPWSKLRPGDLILMTATYFERWSFDEYLCHIEVYCGNGTMIGHPGGTGPTEKRAQAWMESYGCITWMVRRILTDDGDDGDMPTVSEIWNYPITDPNGNTYPAYQHLSWGRYYSMNAEDDVWGHGITDTHGGQDIPAWQLLTWTRTYGLSLYEQMPKMQAQLDELTKMVKELKAK
ncbi:NlpC/P60 family protein [Eggerthella sinensis]|jgi:cell wall-associated NlpC family hydrolase|uniref:NlpC/P60 family protein n=1 Tax=Eggerthella sinensis TaxID=242230 RepID=UPI00266DB7AF|nr:NlpC/P60 family protein [Eggerthella sinensis]